MGVRMRNGALTLLALLTLAASQVRAATQVSVALEKLDALESSQDPAGAAERQALARTALELAGPGVVVPVAARLSAGGMRCAIAAWALGESSPDGGQASPEVTVALRQAMSSGDWDCRLSAAAAAGRLGLTDAGPDVVRMWSEPWRPPGTDGVMLLAIAGCAGDSADPLIAEMLARGGNEAWSTLVIAASLRRGPGSWPVLVDAACGSPDPDVRATASLALLLQAEPLAGCELAECAAAEPDAAIRRLKYQALGAQGSPSGRALLLHVAQHEVEPGLRLAAASLALLPMQGDTRSTLSVSSLEVREALQDAMRKPPGRQGMADIEAGAAMVDIGAIERTLRLLPLRADGAWMDDHARLAQLRARLLCTADPDCDPPAPRVGRPPG